MKLCYRQPERKEDYDRCEYDDKKKYDDKKCDYDYGCCDRHKYSYCYPKNPCPYPILFECAQGSCAEITRTVSNGQGQGNNVLINNFFPRSLGCVTIDTTCLKKPSSKI